MPVYTQRSPCFVSRSGPVRARVFLKDACKQTTVLPYAEAGLSVNGLRREGDGWVPWTQIICSADTPRFLPEGLRDWGVGGREARPTGSCSGGAPSGGGRNAILSTLLGSLARA